MGELGAKELVGLADLAGNGGRTGGAVGPCPIDGGAVFRRRTLEWVVQIAFGNQELLYQKIAGAGAAAFKAAQWTKGCSKIEETRFAGETRKSR